MLRMLESSGVCFGASLPKWFAPDPALSCQSPSTKESADKLPTPTNMIHPLNLPPLSAIPTTPSSKPGRRPNSDPRAQHYKPRKSIYSCATKTGSSTQKAFWRAKKQSNAKIQKLTKQVNTLQCDKHNLKKETKSLKEDLNYAILISEFDSEMDHLAAQMDNEWNEYDPMMISTNEDDEYKMQLKILESSLCSDITDSKIHQHLVNQAKLDGLDNKWTIWLFGTCIVDYCVCLELVVVWFGMIRRENKPNTWVYVLLITHSFFIICMSWMQQYSCIL
eukprot:204999_1